MKYGYARVSTRDQNPDLQVDRLRQVGCEQIVWETASGAKSDRPVLRSLLERMHADLQKTRQDLADRDSEVTALEASLELLRERLRHNQALLAEQQALVRLEFVLGGPIPGA